MIILAKLVPLFSGSKGNSYYIGSSGQGVLIDAGRSCKQIENAMKANDLDIKSVGAIFITHEHTDHCKALRVLASRYKIKVFASLGTLKALEYADMLDSRFPVEVISKEAVVGDMLITRVNTSHDAAESCGFSIVCADGRKATVATDTGCMNDDIRRQICSSNIAVIESNHDVNMLKNGYYPYMLKRRILSDIGHLSNDCCANELADFVKNGCNRFVLGHLSEENNTPEVALQTSLCTLSQAGMKQNSDFEICVAPPETNGKRLIF